jgi:hypothetical protein
MVELGPLMFSGNATCKVGSAIVGFSTPLQATPELGWQKGVEDVR